MQVFSLLLHGNQQKIEMKFEFLSIFSLTYVFSFALSSSFLCISGQKGPYAASHIHGTSSRSFRSLKSSTQTSKSFDGHCFQTH